MAEIISLTGFMGSGKSTVGRALAESLSWDFVDLDAYVEHKAGRSIPEVVAECEERFRAMEAEAVRDVVVMHEITGTNMVLALGGGTFCNPVVRAYLLAHTRTVYLKVSFATAAARVAACPAVRPLWTDEAESLYLSRLPVYEKAAHTVDAEGDDLLGIVERISYICH